MYMFNYELQNFRGMPIHSNCPGCGRDKTYQRYVPKTGRKGDVEDHIGKCDSGIDCGYQNKPLPSVFVPSFIPTETFSSSLNKYHHNNLFIFLTRNYGIDQVTQAFERYSIGTSQAFQGAAVLWQIDIQNKIRTGKIVLFDANTGLGHIKGWVHERMVKPFTVSNCLFGEHLLVKDPTKTIVIVENEMTAIAASCKYPDYLWLSAHGSPPDSNGRRALSNRYFICEPNTWNGEMPS